MTQNSRQSRSVDDEVVEVIRGTVLDVEGIVYGYFPNYSIEAMRKVLQRLRRQGRIVSSDGRRGFYVVPGDGPT